MGVKNSTTLDYLEKKNERSNSNVQSEKKLMQLPNSHIETHVRQHSYDEKDDRVILL